MLIYLIFFAAVWNRVLGTNVKALFFLTREMLPLLDAAAATSQHGACVLNIGSVGGLQPQSLATYAYDTSKAAVHHLTRVLAAKLARRPHGGKIRVNGIAPGLVPTRMTRQIAPMKHRLIQAIPLGRLAEPSDLAGAALYLSSAAGAWVTGIVLCVDGGQTFATAAGMAKL